MGILIFICRITKMLPLALMSEQCTSNMRHGRALVSVTWGGEGKGMAAPQLYVTDPLHSHSLPRSNDYKTFIM